MLIERARTIAIGLLGFAVFWTLSLPLPFLLGPLFACLSSALLGVRHAAFANANKGARVVLGVAVGASITPALIATLPEIGLSIALVPLYTIVLIGVGYPYYRKICGFDRATSYYASVPGGLQDMLLFGEEAGGDPRALALAHATRVAFIVMTMPFLITIVAGSPLDAAPGEPASSVPAHEYALMIAAGLGGWWLAAKVGLFGAPLLGPLIAAAVLSLGDLVHHRPPAEAIALSQFVLGVGVGAAYNSVTAEEVRKIVKSAFVHAFLLFLAGVAFALISYELGAGPLAATLLAFSPGGQADMAILALTAGVDVAFVVAHHVIRLVLVIVCAKPIEHLARRWGGDKDAP